MITLEDPLAETVLVTGHVVTVVRVISVTVDPSGAGELDSGLTLVGTVTLGAEVGPGTTAVLVVAPAEHLVHTVDVEVIVTVEIVWPVETTVEPPVV